MSQNSFHSEHLKDGVSVLVAAKNEEDQLFNTVCNIIEGANRAQFQAFEIIIYDDGSTDKTTQIAMYLAKNMSTVRVIRNEKSQGLGALFIHVIDEAKYSKLAFVAGDNNAHSDLAEALFKNWDKADVVVSYFLNVEYRSRFRIILSTIYSDIYNTVFGLHLMYINGNGIYPIKLLKELGLKADGYGISAEILVKSLRKGVQFYEVAAYANPDATKSQSITLKNLTKVVLAFLRLVWTVYVSERDKYKYKPQRTHVPAYRDHKSIPGSE